MKSESGKKTEDKHTQSFLIISSMHLFQIASFHFVCHETKN